MKDKHPLETLHPRVLAALGDSTMMMQGRTLLALSDLYRFLQSEKAIGSDEESRLEAYAQAHNILAETAVKYLHKLAGAGLLSEKPVPQRRSCKRYSLNP